MAFYVWIPLSGSGAHADPSWPAPSTWSDERTPVDEHMGWKTFLGSEVCGATPWKTLPAELWLCEVEGDHFTTPTDTVWERIKLIECVGTLKESDVAEVVYRWVQTQYLNEMIHNPFPRDSRFRIEWVANQLKNLRAFMDDQPYDKELLQKHSYTPLTFGTRAVESAKDGDYTKAWKMACNIAKDCMNKNTLLDMAGRLREVMNNGN